MIAEKIEQAAGILRELDIDCWMIFTRESANVHDPCIDLVVGANVTWASAFIITKDAQKIAVVGSLDKAAHDELGYYTEIIPYVKGISTPLRETISRLNPGKIALNYSMNQETADGLTHGQFLLLQDIFKGTPFLNRFVSSEDVVTRLRSRKQPSEIARIETACKHTVEIFDQLNGALKTGLSEKEIAKTITGLMEEKDLTPAWDVDHCPAVFTGPESAGAHASPTDRLMEPGHLMNVDFGVRYEEYCSDLQRTWYCLKPGETQAPAEVQKAFDTLMEAVDKAAQYLKPGVISKDVDAIARDHIVGQGFDEYPHALGHQIGRVAHDAGILAPPWERYGEKPNAVIEEGQCYTIEPRINVPGFGVATIEEIVVVTTDGVRYLSEPQKEIMLVKSPKNLGA